MDNPQRFPPSQVALAFPDASPEEEAKLEASIARYGQRVPISVQNGEVVDGRRRQAACERLGIEPVYEFLDDDVNRAQYAVDRNTLHRDLSTSQKAYVAAKLSMLSPRGRPRQDGEKSAKWQNYTRQKAADLMTVGVRQVNRAVKITAEDGPAVPELRRAVAMGQVQVADAEGVLGQTPEVQRRALERVTNGTTRTMKQAVQRIKAEAIRQRDSENRAAVPSNIIRQDVELHVGEIEDFKTRVPAESVDVIVTQPPLTAPGLESCEAIGRFAAHALKETGILAVVCFGPMLLSMLQRLAKSGLPWVGELDIVFDGPPITAPQWRHDVAIRRLPVVIFGKGSCHLEAVDDVIEVPAREHLPPGWDRTGAALVGLVERLAHRGDRVCDPAMAGRHWTALGAWRANGAFTGADSADSKVSGIWDGLDREAGRIQLADGTNAGTQFGEEA